jgi:hypothetical protein
MPLPKREAGNVLEAMKMESACVDWLKGKEAVHHNSSRVLFEDGAGEPLMQFLIRRAICPQSMAGLAPPTHIPTKTLRSWRKGLLKDPSHRPYS